MLRGIDFNPSIGGWQDNVSIETLETVVEFAWGKVSEGWGWRVPAENTMRRVEVAIRRGFPMGGRLPFRVGRAQPARSGTQLLDRDRIE